MSSPKSFILYQDQHIVVANKPNAVGVSPVRNENRSFMRQLEAYVKKSIYCVHRIDVPVSGVVIFAKTKRAAAHLGHQFKEKKVVKTYMAVSRCQSAQTEGHWEDKMLKHFKGNKSCIVDDHEKAKMAKCTFKRLESLDHIHLYQLSPSTGRHHQLRVQMAHHIGPIRGDQKYGDKRNNRDRSIDLHAFEISFHHPFTNARMTCQAPPPPKPPWTHFSIFQTPSPMEKERLSNA